MISYNWIYRCDYCEVEVVSTIKFVYYTEHPIIRPGIVPDLSDHGRWRNVDGLLVCPKHIVHVIINKKEEDDK